MITDNEAKQILQKRGLFHQVRSSLTIETPFCLIKLTPSLGKMSITNKQGSPTTTTNRELKDWLNYLPKEIDGLNIPCQWWFEKFIPSLREIISIIDSDNPELSGQEEHHVAEHTEEDGLCEDAAIHFNLIQEEIDELKREKQHLSKLLLEKDNVISDLTGTNVLLNQANKLQNELLDAKDQNIALIKTSHGIKA